MSRSRPSTQRWQSSRSRCARSARSRAQSSRGRSTAAPRERELIALKFHAGLSNLDLARVLGVSESNAGTLLHRAITKLRKACDEQA